MILNDSEIAKLCTLGVDGSLPMLEPFRGYETKNRGVIRILSIGSEFEPLARL